MKITKIFIQFVDIAKFAEEHGLEMEIRERGPSLMSDMGMDYMKRFYAKFKDSGIKEGCMLAGVYGNGATPEQAIQNYCHKIQGRLLVIGAYSDVRREIQVPEKLIYAPEGKE